MVLKWLDSPAGAAQLERHTATGRSAAGSIARQGPCLGGGFGPWFRHVQEATHQCFSLALMFLSTPCSKSSEKGVLR